MPLILVQTGHNAYSAHEAAESLERQGIHPSQIDIGHGIGGRRVEVEVTPQDAGRIAEMLELIASESASQ